MSPCPFSSPSPAPPDVADSACVGSGNGTSGPLARLAAFLEQERPSGKHTAKFLLQGDAAAQDPAFLALMVTTTSPRWGSSKTTV